MKKLIFPILLALVLVVGTSIPVSAALVEENWVFVSYNNNVAYAYFTINMTNLQVSSFTIVNNSDQPVYVYLLESGQPTPFFEIYANPYQTVTQPISNFKFHRLPLTDPDDPGSLRYPNGVGMYSRYG